MPHRDADDEAAENSSVRQVLGPRKVLRGSGGEQLSSGIKSASVTAFDSSEEDPVPKKGAESSTDGWQSDKLKDKRSLAKDPCERITSAFDAQSP